MLCLPIYAEAALCFAIVAKHIYKNDTTHNSPWCKMVVEVALVAADGSRMLLTIVVDASRRSNIAWMTCRIAH